MAVEAVIFDWGGTLTPWHSVDYAALWRQICAQHFAEPRVGPTATALLRAELDLWRLCEVEYRSSTMAEVFRRAGVELTAELTETYARAWAPHTHTDPDVPALLASLRDRGIRVGVLSNTMWPRDWHEQVFRRDGVLHLFDGAVYTSEIERTKPHRDAFAAAMNAVGARDPAACVFVGDRPFDDIHGARQAGMRAVLLPNSSVPPFPVAVPDAVLTRLSDLLPLIDSWENELPPR